MRTISVVIADENQTYSKALSEYLQGEYGQAFDIYCFTSTKSLIEHLETKQQTDILLVDLKLYNDSLKAYKVKTTIILTDANTENDVNGMATLYKYQLGDKIAKNILQSYDSSGSERFSIHSQPRNSKLIAVYSPTGGSGKSTIAYNLSRQYALQGKKSILVSMESFASMPIFKSESKSHGLSYLMYLINNKTNNLQVKLDAIKDYDANANIYYIPRDANSLEYKGDNQAEIASLLEFFKIQSGYDSVIFDLDSSVSDRLMNVFKYCDVILNITSSDNISKNKHEGFNKQLNIYNDLLGVNLANKIINVNNKVMRLNDSKEVEKSENNILEIPYLNDSAFMESGFYPELVYFKQLYDSIEDFFKDKRLEE